MNAETFFREFGHLADSQNGVAELRELILQLAVRGKLVPQNPSDEPARVLADRMSAQKRQHGGKGSKNGKPLPPVAPLDAPFLLPPNWEWVRIGEALHLINGRAFKPTEWSDKGLPIIRIQNLNNVNASFNYCNFHVDERFHVTDGDFLVSWSGTPGTSFGAFIWDGGPAVLNQHIFRGELFGAAFKLPFLKCAINSQLHVMIAQAHGGVGLRHITKDKLERLCIPLPPWNEQGRIVAKVDELMALCNELEARQQEQRQIRVRLNDAALDRLVTPADADDFTTAWERIRTNFDLLYDTPETVAKLRQAILQLAVQGKLTPLSSQDEELMARGTHVGDYLKMQNGYAFKSQWFETDGVRLVRNANVGHGKLNWSDVVRISEERAKEYERFQMREGDIVLTLDRPLISTGLKVAKITRNDMPSLLLQRVARPIYNDDSVHPDYFYIWLNSPAFTDSIDPGKSNGVPHISTREVQKIPFAPPTVFTQMRVLEIVGKLMVLCDELDARLRKADEHGETLCQAAVAWAVSTNGKVESGQTEKEKASKRPRGGWNGVDSVPLSKSSPTQ